MRARAPSAMRTGANSRATLATSSMVNGRTPSSSTLFNRELVLLFERLFADGIGDLDADRELAGLGVLQQVDAHRGLHIALRVEGVALFHGGLRLRPQKLAARRIHHRHVADVDVVLLGVLEAGDIEARPDGIAG